MQKADAFASISSRTEAQWRCVGKPQLGVTECHAAAFQGSALTDGSAPPPGRLVSGAHRSAEFFEWLEQNAVRLAGFECEAEEHMVRPSAEFHMAQIAREGDSFEVGSAHSISLQTHRRLLTLKHLDLARLRGSVFRLLFR